MHDFFEMDGPLFTFMTRAGQIIIISLLWILLSLPVITLLPATSALYYATIKAVRRSRGYAHKEFFRSFKHSFKKGIPGNLLYAVIVGFILYNMLVLKVEEPVYNLVYVLVLAAALMSFVYLVPILSRFEMKLKDMIKLSIYMSLRHLPTTLLLLGGLGLVIFLQIRFLPMLTVVFIPGLWCYISTFLIEKAMKKYMNKAQDEDKDTWYLE